MQTEGVDLDGLKATLERATQPQPDVPFLTEVLEANAACMELDKWREYLPALIAEIERLRAAPAEAELRADPWPSYATIRAAEQATRNIGGMMAALAVGYFAMCCYARPISAEPAQAELRADVERVARAIAREILAQDGIEDFTLKPDLKIEWLDQGEVDFGAVARAALAATEEAK